MKALLRSRAFLRVANPLTSRFLPLCAVIILFV